MKTDGTLACWGDNAYGQSSPPAGTFSQVSAGYIHNCAVRTDANLACWGAGMTTGAYPNFGQAAPPAGTFGQVSAGQIHTCGVRTDGTLACWGDNASGQVSPPSARSASSPPAGTTTAA